jgi:hypothetical protein
MTSLSIAAPRVVGVEPQSLAGQREVAGAGPLEASRFEGQEPDVRAVCARKRAAVSRLQRELTRAPHRMCKRSSL